MILSEFILDIQDMKDLGVKDDYSLHRVVYDLFQDTKSLDRKIGDSDRPFLYFEKARECGQIKIFILSDRVPIPPKYGRILSKEISSEFMSFQNYNFEVLINPSYRCNKTSKIICLRDEEKILKWFSGKSLDSWGFSIKNLAIKKKIIKRFTKKGDTVTIGGSLLFGEFTVVDRSRFLHSFKNGLGRGKAWGFGLLQLIPINQKI